MDLGYIVYQSLGLGTRSVHSVVWVGREKSIRVIYYVSYSYSRSHNISRLLFHSISNLYMELIPFLFYFIAPTADHSAGSDCNRKTEFQCRSGLCLPLDSVCNQKNDCGNWEDEPKDKCGVNECLVQNGGCSELCVDTPGGFFCDCKSGFRLNDNGTCEGKNM